MPLAEHVKCLIPDMVINSQDKDVSHFKKCICVINNASILSTEDCELASYEFQAYVESADTHQILLDYKPDFDIVEHGLDYIF